MYVYTSIYMYTYIHISYICIYLEPFIASPPVCHDADALMPNHAIAHAISHAMAYAMAYAMACHGMEWHDMGTSRNP